MTPAIMFVLVAAFLAGCESHSGPTWTTPNDDSSSPAAAPTGLAHPSGSIEPPGTDDHPEHAHPAAPAKDAAPVAAAFAHAWARRDLPAEKWLDQITPLCTSVFGRQLATADPRNLPADRVTGKPKAVHGPADRQAEYTVATNGGTLTVELVDLQGRWQVSGNDFTASSR